MENKFRLPKTIIPSYYSITIETDLDNEKFSGSEIISIEIKEKINTIKLNSIGLKIDKAEIINDQLKSESITEDKEHETISINFNKDFEPGEYKLKLNFHGNLDNSLRGFYLSRYKDENGVDHKIGTTQFESTDARRAFPCFDEPEFKSIFAITLKVPKGLFTVSNTGIKSIKNTNTHDIYEFEDSIKMSTYLVAFVIGPFEATDEVMVDGVPLRIVHAIGKSHLTDFAIETGKFALKYFTDYFGRPYPGDKLDMIAIPDFASGAMENLGCITYREALLLVNKDEATQGELTRIADVVMHEIAHMWFGDLVTMKWWNGIWLNEAFATFMATKAVDKFNPKWERWVEFGIEKSAAFDVDSLKSTRPIEYDVISPDDATAMFDLLTYEKGGAVLRMLEQYVGEEPFRDGIRSYLNKHEFSNTETEDLWDSIEEFSSIPVRETMNSWILQPGFPRISIKNQKNSISISQSTFRYDNSNDKTIWKVPVEIKYELKGKVQSKKILLEEKSSEINMETEIKLISGNSNANGFYRSEYETINDFSNEINFLNKSEKFSLIDDLWASSVSCRIPINIFLNNSLLFKKDTDPELQSLIISRFSSLKRYANKDLKKKYISIIENYALNLIEEIGEEPKEGEDLKIKELRAILYRTLSITCENNIYIEKLNNIYNQYNLNKGSIDPNITASAIASVAYYGNESTYRDYFQKYTEGETPQEKMRFLYSLAEFRDTKLLEKTLDASLSEEIKNQDAPYLIAYALRDYRHCEKTWNFIEKNWKDIIKKFPDNTIPRIFGGIKIISNIELADKINLFFKNNPIPQGQKTINQNLEKMYQNINFVNYQKEKFNNWLK